MKKKVLAIVVVFMLVCGVVSASSINGSYQGEDIVKVTANGKVLAVEDVPATIHNDRTVVPLVMLKQLGVGVKWDEATFSVDVTLPKSEPVIQQDPNVQNIKKYAAVADYSVYLERSLNFIYGLSASMDDYVNGKMNDTQIKAEVDKNAAKVNEVYQKGVSANSFVGDAAIWGNTNELMTAFYAVNDQLVDAYVDAVAYRMSVANPEYSSVTSDMLASYNSKVGAAHSKANALIEKLRNSYDDNISKVFK